MKSPYLKPQRLPDVIAAITALGTYKFYKLDVDRWADRITGSADRAGPWRTVFEEHPEFFRYASDRKKVSLVLRRQFPRNYNVDAEPEEFPDHEVDGLTESRISRRPLSPAELTELVGFAIRLHDSSLEQQKATTWWTPLATAVLSLVGVLLGAYVSQHA